MSIHITEHAIERARQRLGWSATSLQRMTDRVLGFGLSSGNAPVPVRRYMQAREAEDGTLVRSYGEHFFVFQRGEDLGALSLITVWQVPLELRSLLRRSRKTAQST